MNRSLEQHFSIEQFIFKETLCIDEKRWDDWLSLFADDSDYWIPINPNEKSPGNTLSIMYEDKVTLQLRCARYNHPHIHSQQPPSRTSHIVSNFMFEEDSSNTNLLAVRAQFHMCEYRQERRIDWDGALIYFLQSQEDAYLIKRKKVLLVDAQAALETIHIPF